jgi:hypothetical protein
MFRFAFLVPIVWALASSGARGEIAIPSTRGIEIQVGRTVAIPGARSAIVHDFDDGRIVVMGANRGIWSADHGHTWSDGPPGPDDKTVIKLGRGAVLSIHRTSVKRPDGKYMLVQRRSRDNWKTVISETAVLDTPLATTTGGDDGGQHDGMLMHHGSIQLKNGDLMATMYGNYRGDRIPASGYPEALHMFKCRTIVVFSSDEGRTWGRPATVAYDRQLARGTDPDSSVQTTAPAPAITQEGFNEATLARAANGDILCAMRSGGRIGNAKAPIYPTPLYLSRSQDEGQSWTPPVPIADRGSCPYMTTLHNGIIVCAYARPGGWLIFSDDDGRTWKGAFEFASSDSYCNVIETAPNEIMVVYYGGDAVARRAGSKGAGYFGTFFTVTRK